MKENAPVTWLHLSDLHACRPKTGWEAKGILDNLKKDFKKVEKQHNLRPDLIFFTGDAAFGQLGPGEGKSITEQFKEAENLFEEIRNSFSTPVPKENLFLVPGNHDVNRTKVMSMVHKGFDQLVKMKHDVVREILSEMIRDKDANWQGVMTPLADYRRFLEEYGCTHLLQDPDRLIYGHIRDIRGVKVGIAGLNSAWSCGKDDQKGKLWLAGQWQIRTLSQLINGADVKIALMHHPFNWFNPVEDPQLDRSMRKHFDFLLHGHEHDHWVEELKRGFITISAGACYAGSSKELGYNMVRWNVTGGGGKAWLRTYDTKGGGWVPELIACETDDTGGAWELGNDEEGLPTPRVTPPTPEQKRKDIPPDSPESRGIFGRKGDIERIKKSLDSSPMVGIYGMAGIGKSQIVKEIKRLPQFKGMDYVPCFVNKEMDLQNLFRQLARALGCTDEEPKADFKGGVKGTSSFSRLAAWAKFSKPAFIHLIDVHLFFEDYKLKSAGIKEFLEAVCKYYPGSRIVLESRITLKNEFPPTVCPMFYIGGIDSAGMALYFKYPFKEDPSVGWKLTVEQEAFLFRRLGGSKDLGGAMPLAMMLLANVAKGTKIHPVQVLKEYEGEKEFVEKLEERLFNDLYENVLTDAEQHMLRLCALYREGIPNSHENALNGVVEAPGVFWHLVQRCLLDTTASEDWYFLHAIIAQLTRRRIDRLGNREQYWNDHDTIAGAWLAQLKLGSQPSLPNIKAANEAFHHLTEGESYDRYYELSDKLLRKDVVSHLDQRSGKLQEDEKYDKNRHVLELLVRLEPNEPRYHRFLAQTIEKVKGKGDDEALKHYREARRLLPDYPDYLNVLGRCLLARGESEVFIEEVEKLSDGVYHKVMDQNNLAIYARCLGRVGREEKASGIRMKLIDNGILNPIFYNDEANYLARNERFAEALEIIRKAEDNKCADEFIISVKATVLEKSGHEADASALRRWQIEKEVKHSAFYNDEANYLARNERFAEALEIIRKAEENSCTDHHTLAIKATVLEKNGHEADASELRRRQIEKGARNPAFYTDEANYLTRNKRFQEAMEIIKKVEPLGIADRYTRGIKEKIKRGLERI